MTVKNDWKRRLEFRAPAEFRWRKDPPPGFKVGDIASYYENGRHFIKNPAGNPVNLDEIGALYLGYITPADHRPKRKRASPEVINSRWGVNVREQCEAAGVPLQTYYGRRHVGMDHEFALRATTAEVRRWRANAASNGRMLPENVTKAYAQATMWVARENLDRYVAPLSREGFAALMEKGLNPKQAILHREVRMPASRRKAIQKLVMRSARDLQHALPDVVRLLAPATGSPGVMMAVRLLAALSMMAGSEDEKFINPELVYGNLALAVLASGEQEKSDDAED